MKSQGLGTARFGLGREPSESIGREAVWQIPAHMSPCATDQGNRLLCWAREMRNGEPPPGCGGRLMRSGYKRALWRVRDNEAFSVACAADALPARPGVVPAPPQRLQRYAGG